MPNVFTCLHHHAMCVFVFLKKRNEKKRVNMGLAVEFGVEGVRGTDGQTHKDARAGAGGLNEFI